MFWLRGVGFTHILLGTAVGLASACMSVGSVVTSENQPTNMMMYDFRTVASLDNWEEVSDTEREPGMSKGAFVLQKTQLFQRAVMFSMLNPQPNGAGFVGFDTNETWDLSSYNGIELRVRGQGDNYVYKMNLRHNGEGSGKISYQAFYKIPNNEWTNIALPLVAFKPYYRGQLVPDAEPLNTSSITTITLQIVGGVYSDFKQSGASSLEIDYIEAVL